MIRDVIASAAFELKRSFRALVSTDLFYQLAAFALLTPLVSLGIRSLVSLSGSAVLADREILQFALRPIGIGTLVAAAAGRIAILAVGQACLMGIVFGAARSARVAPIAALAWGAARAGKVLAVTTRLVVRVLVLCAPFLALAALAYSLLLTDSDINYYLNERPPVFWAAAVVIGSVLAVMTALLVRSATSWVYALPLLLFENVKPSKALAESAKRASGHRLTIAFVLLGWVAAVAIASALGLSGARALAVAIFPRFRESVSLLVPALGLAVVIGTVAGAIATAIASSLFAALVVALYEGLGGGSRAVAESIDGDGTRRYLFSGRQLLYGVFAAAVVSGAVGWILLGRIRDPRPVA